MGTGDQIVGSRAELRAVLQRLLQAGRANSAAAVRQIEPIDRELRHVLSVRAVARSVPGISDQA
jgi:hypothetical protein